MIEGGFGISGPGGGTEGISGPGKGGGDPGGGVGGGTGPGIPGGMGGVLGGGMGEGVPGGGIGGKLGGGMGCGVPGGTMGGVLGGLIGGPRGTPDPSTSEEEKFPMAILNSGGPPGPGSSVGVGGTRISPGDTRGPLVEWKERAIRRVLMGIPTVW
ncbi:unnamed protein product [Calypogeia fissa]